MCLGFGVWGGGGGGGGEGFGFGALGLLEVYHDHVLLLFVARSLRGLEGL